MAGIKAQSEKRDTIIDAAIEVFLDQGYGTATVDEVVQLAGGSKATVYKYFKNKEELFSTVIGKMLKRGPMAEELNPDELPEQALTKYAESRLKTIFSPEHSRLRRLIIGEGIRFPSIAHKYYQHGPELGKKYLLDYFQTQIKRGTLQIEDMEFAAEMFQSMLTHAFYLKTLFMMPDNHTAKAYEDYARKVVETFLKIYGV